MRTCLNEKPSSTPRSSIRSLIESYYTEIDLVMAKLLLSKMLGQSLNAPL